MNHRRRTPDDVAPKHAGRPGAWAQLPWRVLGMLFIAALLLASQQLALSAPDQAGDVSRAPATGP